MENNFDFADQIHTIRIGKNTKLSNSELSMIFSMVTIHQEKLTDGSEQNTVKGETWKKKKKKKKEICDLEKTSYRNLFT